MHNKKKNKEKSTYQTNAKYRSEIEMNEIKRKQKKRK